MFTVVIYILRRLADQNSPQGRQARDLLELIVGRIKAWELAQLDREKAELPASGQRPVVDADAIDMREDIEFRRQRLLDAGVDSALRDWWFRLQLPGEISVRPVPTKLIEAIGFELIGQAVAPCVYFLVEQKPEITAIDRQKTISQLDRLGALIRLPRPGAGVPAASFLGGTFSAWSSCGGERGRPPWLYQGFEKVVPPDPD